MAGLLRKLPLKMHSELIGFSAIMNTPPADMVELSELARVVRLVFGGFKLALAKGVIVTHSRTTMAV